MSWIDWDELTKTRNARSWLTYGGSKSRWSGDRAKQTAMLCVEVCWRGSKGLSYRGASMIRRGKTRPIFQIKHLPGHNGGCGTTLAYLDTRIWYSGAWVLDTDVLGSSPNLAA